MNNERIVYLDVIRILACFMIVFMHAPIPNTGISSHVLIMDSVLTAPGVGLFVMVSGALLLPVNFSTNIFIRKRLFKLVVPSFIWTLLYMVVGLQSGTIAVSGILKSIISIPFSAQFNGVFWFVYMLIGLYLLAPVISPWLERASRKELEVYLGIWGITLCYPLIRNFVFINQGDTGILYYFGGYAGYFLLGYYLRRYFLHLPIMICLFLITLPLIVGTYCKLWGIKVVFFDVFWYQSILTVSASVGWFVIVQRLASLGFLKKSSHFIAQISNCCFGIYLSHIFVMRTCLWNWEPLQNLWGGIQILVVAILTFFGSFVITWLLSKSPLGGYLVGYRNKSGKKW